jgi:hypothetical protein
VGCFGQAPLSCPRPLSSALFDNPCRPHGFINVKFVRDPLQIKRIVATISEEGTGGHEVAMMDTLGRLS